MALITAIIQDESGNQQGSEVVFLGRMLPQSANDRYSCLRFVDPSGDTVFNSVQLPFLLDDLHLLEESIEDPEDRHAIQELSHLVRRCQLKPHLYPKMIGD